MKTVTWTENASWYDVLRQVAEELDRRPEMH